MAREVVIPGALGVGHTGTAGAGTALSAGHGMDQPHTTSIMDALSTAQGPAAGCDPELERESGCDPELRSESIACCDPERERECPTLHHRRFVREDIQC